MQQQVSNFAVSEVPPGGPGPVYMPIPIRSTTYDRYQHRQSIGLGITQIIIGILCIIFNSISLAVTSRYNAGVAFIGHGYWCGVLFILTGSFGVRAGFKKTRCLIVAFMVTCIVTAVITVALLIIGIVGAVVAENYEKCDYYDYYYDYNNGYGYRYPGYYYPPCEKMRGYKLVVAMEASMAILAFIEGIIAIWGSALCCGSGVCCCCSYSTPNPGYFPNNGQVVYINQSQAGQCFYVPQSMYPYSQAMTAPPYDVRYAQPAGWAMPPPINTTDSQIGQAPPEYPATLQVTSDPGQPTEQAKY